MSDGVPVFGGDRLLRGGVVAALVGGVAVVAGAVLAPRQTAYSYVAAFAYWLGLALGALLFVMVQHAINSTWFIVLRRVMESFAGSLPIFALLFLPILAWYRDLYGWVVGGRAVEAQAVYLAAPFLAVRAAIYFSVWTVVAALLTRWTLSQWSDAGAPLARRQRALSAVMLPVVAFAGSFASFDWLMALTPGWFSTVFGLYVLVGGVLGALALLAVASDRLLRDGTLAGAVTVSHTHALGKLMFTLLILWAYLAFFQYMLIWIADLPQEVVWYADRERGGWVVVGWVLVVGHFAVPFVALLSRDLKRRPAALAAVGAWLLVMHYVDLYWIVLPALHATGPRPHVLDLAALVAVGGAAVAFGAWRSRGKPALATADPRYERSLEFHTA